MEQKPLATGEFKATSMASFVPWCSAVREDLEGCPSSPTIQSWTGFLASRMIEVYVRSPAKFLLSKRADRVIIPSAGIHS